MSGFLNANAMYSTNTSRVINMKFTELNNFLKKFEGKEEQEGVHK